jgi:hypothetical protein
MTPEAMAATLTRVIAVWGTLTPFHALKFGAYKPKDGDYAVIIVARHRGTKRYRMLLFVQAPNLTNQRNYAGYSGRVTSPFSPNR